VKRRKEWKQLRKLVSQLGLRLVVLQEDDFGEQYDPGIRSLFDPHNHKIVFNRKTNEDEDIALFALAHELGHAMDHMSEPHLAEEYGLHYHLAKVYARFDRDIPDESRRVFQDREDMANDLAESVLEEFGITISIDAMEACIHH
jgi:hypothetical protein